MDFGGNGYWDEHMVYHRFGDEDDPEAYPPTPGPVSSGGFNNPNIQAAADLLLDPDTSLADPQSIQADAELIALPSSDETYLPFKLHSRIPSAFLRHTPLKLHLATNRFFCEKTLLQPNLFLEKSSEVRSRLLGRLEGILIGQWAELGFSLAECYQLCDISRDDILAAIENNPPNGPTSEQVMRQNAAQDVTMELSRNDFVLQPRDPNMRGGAGEPEQDGEDEDSEASLSDCPSDLSDWDMRDLAKKTPSRAQLKAHTSCKQHEAVKKDRKGPNGSVGGRGSSVDSAVSGISTRRRSARHAEGGKDLGIAGSIAI